jgi:hypothetical protein
VKLSTIRSPFKLWSVTINNYRTTYLTCRFPWSLRVLPCSSNSFRNLWRINPSLHLETQFSNYLVLVTSKSKGMIMIYIWITNFCYLTVNKTKQKNHHFIKPITQKSFSAQVNFHPLKTKPKKNHNTLNSNIHFLSLSLYSSTTKQTPSFQTKLLTTPTQKKHCNSAQFS